MFPIKQRLVGSHREIGLGQPGFASCYLSDRSEAAAGLTGLISSEEVNR